MFTLKLALLASAVAVASAAGPPSSASAASRLSFDNLFCRDLLDRKVLNCVLAKFGELRLDQTPDNICLALTKEFYHPCLSEEQRHCIHTNGDFDRIFESVKEGLTPEMREKCWHEVGNGAPVAKASIVMLGATMAVVRFTT